MGQDRNTSVTQLQIHREPAEPVQTHMGWGGRGDRYHAASDPPRTGRARNGIVSGLREWKDGIHLSDRGEDVTVC